MGRLFIVLALWLLAGFFFGKVNRRLVDRVNHVYEQKVARLATLPHANGRVLISGGSNAFWGISSKTIAEKMRRPAFNLSLEADAFDADLMRRLTLNHVQVGDTVVYSSLSFWIKNNFDHINAILLANRIGITDYRPKSTPLFWRVLDWWRPTPRGTSFADLAFRFFLIKEDKRPEPGTIDDYGDFVGCIPKKIAKPLNISEVNDGNDFHLEVLPFKKAIEDRGGRLVVVAPWILIEEAQKPQWQKHFENTAKRLPELFHDESEEMASALRTDRREFCNGPSHLTREMAAERARTQIVQKLGRVENFFDQG